MEIDDTNRSPSCIISRIFLLLFGVTPAERLAGRFHYRAALHHHGVVAPVTIVVLAVKWPLECRLPLPSSSSQDLDPDCKNAERHVEVGLARVATVVVVADAPCVHS